ncbi:MAG: FAD-dependent oxidoreductase [Bacteroidota bacterium]|nr:FAD-dependent oxidoreductase [Kiloniellaceae bacterium]
MSSYWLATAAETDFPALDGDLATDVVVVGGGIAGLTTAALVKQSGRRVAVVEARRVGRQATGHSTAKVTSQHGVIYRELVRKHGQEGAGLYAEANQVAVERVAQFVRELAIDCDFRRSAAYVYTTSDEGLDTLKEEADCARRLGLPAELVDSAPLPGGLLGAVRFADQAQFHPCKYIAGLARSVEGDGCHVFEHTRVLDIQSGRPLRVETAGGTITADEVVVATQLPIIAEGMFFAKAHPHSEPMLAAIIEPAAAPDGMFISIDEPSLSVMVAPGEGRPCLIAAGGDYKPGHSDDARQAMETLERSVRERFAVGEIIHRWTNHDYWPMDRVPFVGRTGNGQPLVATGFQAWGLSNGTAAGMMLADIIGGRSNRWLDLFDADRLKPLASAPSFLSENTAVAGEMVGGHLKRRPKSPADLGADEAEVVQGDGGLVAAYRDRDGRLHEVSAVCTHMKCVVGWNPVDRTWDCPCHGSRFATDGSVLRGPAKSPLEPRPAKR